MKDVELTVRDKITILINGMGYDLVGCEWVRQDGRKVFRIYIDSPRGVTLDDCARVSHQVSAMLDVEEDPNQSRYLLEVSSPGINRPLFELVQYHALVGQRIKLRLRTPIQTRRNWSGKLLRVENDQIYLLADNEEIVVPFSHIEKANVIADIHLKH